MLHIVPNILPRPLCSWLRNSLHMPEERQNHPIVHFAYLCHVHDQRIWGVLIPSCTLSFWKIVEVLRFTSSFWRRVQKSLFTTDLLSSTTKLICSNFHVKAALMMIDWCCFYHSIRNSQVDLLEALFAPNVFVLPTDLLPLLLLPRTLVPDYWILNSTIHTICRA